MKLCSTNGGLGHVMIRRVVPNPVYVVTDKCGKNSYDFVGVQPDATVSVYKLIYNFIKLDIGYMIA